MRKASWIVLITLLLGAPFAISAGVLLQKIPLTHFCDHIKVIGDKVYILDKDRLGQFFVYQIKEM